MSVRKLRKAGLVATWMLMTGLVACAAGPQIELSEGAASQIRTIALLDIAEPPVDQILHHGSSKESHSSTYAQILSDAQVEFSPLLAEAITRQLERSNYRVLSLPTERPVVVGDDQIDLSAINTDADAILVVRFKGAGYASSSTTALQPWAIVEAQLFDARTRKALYTQIFNGGADLGIDGAVHLATNPRYQYASPEQVETKLDDSVDGIKDAELAIANAMGQDLAVGTRPIAGYVEAARPALVPEKTVAERDREAAAALAAQWAAAAPPPAPAAVEETPANTDDSTSADASTVPATAAVNPSTEAQTTAVEQDAEAITPPATDDAVAPGVPQLPPLAADAAEPIVPETAPPTPAPAPPALPAAVSSDTAPGIVNDGKQTSAVAAAPASVAEVPPTAPIAPAIPAAGVPASSESGLILKQRTPVRVSPTARAQVFAFLPAGTRITRGKRVIHNSSGSWCFIEVGEITGWVPTAAIAR